MEDDRRPKLCAIRRDDPQRADALLAAVASHLRDHGARVVGVLQQDTVRDGRRRCDMELVDLRTGTRMAISRDRGDHARGCRLDEGGMAAAAARIEAQIRDGADIVIINKFGKAEAEGRGLRDAIAQALLHEIPVLTGISDIATNAFQAFAGELGAILDTDMETIVRWLDLFDQNRPSFIGR